MTIRSEARPVCAPVGEHERPAFLVKEQVRPLTPAEVALATVLELDRLAACVAASVCPLRGHQSLGDRGVGMRGSGWGTAGKGMAAAREAAIHVVKQCVEIANFVLE